MLALNMLMVISLHVFQSGTMDTPMGITIGIEPEDQEALNAAMAELQAITLNGVYVTEVLTQNMENFVWFLLPIFVVTAAAIFTHGTVKNDIAFGISRTRLYMSKLMLSVGISVLFLLFYMGTGMLIATVISGFGGPAPAGHWTNLIQVLGAQLFMLIAMVCVGIFFVFTTKRTAAVNGAFIAFVLIPAVIISLLSIANPSLERLLYFDMTSRIINLAGLRYMEARDIAKALGLGAFYMLATTIGGIALFRRAEIK